VNAQHLSADSTPAAARGRWFWPLLVGGLFAGHIALMLMMVYLATRDRSFAVEPDYYQKALNWDQVAAQRQENARLGWGVTIEIGDTPGVLGERTVTCRVGDQSGTPVSGGVVELTAFAHARGSERTSLRLPPCGDGVYRAVLRLPRKGRWEFRLVISRGRDRFTYTEQRNL
jgi:nitrogen fixation protein FixH